MFTSFMHNQHPECRDDGPHNGSQHGHNRPWHHRARPNCHHPSHPNKEPAGSRQVVAQPASWQKERIPFASLRQGPVRVKAAELEIDKKNLRKTKANMASKMNKEAAKKNDAQSSRKFNTGSEAKSQFNVLAKDRTNKLVMVDLKFNPDSVRDEIKGKFNPDSVRDEIKAASPLYVQS